MSCDPMAVVRNPQPLHPRGRLNGLIEMNRKKGDSISKKRKQEALQRIDVHNEWFSKKYMKDDRTIMIRPRFKLDYRDEVLP